MSLHPKIIGQGEGHFSEGSTSLDKFMSYSARLHLTHKLFIGFMVSYARKGEVTRLGTLPN